MKCAAARADDYRRHLYRIRISVDNQQVFYAECVRVITLTLFDKLAYINVDACWLSTHLMSSARFLRSDDGEHYVI